MLCTSNLHLIGYFHVDIMFFYSFHILIFYFWKLKMNLYSNIWILTGAPEIDTTWPTKFIFFSSYPIKYHFISILKIQLFFNLKRGFSFILINWGYLVVNFVLNSCSFLCLQSSGFCIIKVVDQSYKRNYSLFIFHAIFVAWNLK